MGKLQWHSRFSYHFSMIIFRDSIFHSMVVVRDLSNLEVGSSFNVSLTPFI